MSRYNVWLETEEVDDYGDQIQEMDHLCHKMAKVKTLEEAAETFRMIRNCHIAYGRLRQFCDVVGRFSADPRDQQRNDRLIDELFVLRRETIRGLNMVGLSHLVE